MVHLLEHIPHPADFLSGIRDKLELDGFLLVEVPNFLQNPFDLLISDHCSHFTSQLLTNLLTATGYEVITAADDWVPKELTMVARKASRPQGAKDAVSPSDSWQAAIDGLQWLESIKAMAQRLARGSNFGLFGTSIAATWLSTELGDAVSFYVDEDPQRAGKTYLGRPIYFPQGIPSGSHVFIALAYKVAASIYRRLAVRYPEVKFYLPTP
jgi:hypothetical protein